MPKIQQRDLTALGYYLNGSYNDVAVIALPHFEPQTPGDGMNANQEYQLVLRTFLADSVRDGKKKLIVDLRGNGGGTIGE